MLISDVDRLPTTEVLCIYELKPPVAAVATTTLADIIDYGRFHGHVQASARLLPRVANAFTLDPAALGHADGLWPFQAVTCHALVTVRGDPLVALSMELDSATPARVGDVAHLLAVTCFGRDQLTVAGLPILGWLESETGWSGASFGRNVHQCVFAGGMLAEELLHDSLESTPAPAATTMVYRGTVNAPRGGPLGVRSPAALNNPGETVLAHARGVTVVAGWSRQVQAMFALTAITMVSALGVLHRTRDAAFDALEQNQSARLASTNDARRLISHLSAQLSEIQLDLCFGVEAYTDSVLMPELLVDSFQSSLRESVALQAGLINTSRMVDRLASVIRARAAMLDAADQDERERRGRVFNVVLAIASLIALPPSLLLAFFGVASPDVDPSRSIVDLGQYWLPYVLAWVPFAVLLIIAFVLTWRIRSTPRLAGFNGVEAEFAATVPAPRGGDDALALDKRTVTG